METLAAWSEDRILRVMRAWRRGCGPLLPWFRATPFAAVNHYRDRSLPVSHPAAASEPARRLLAALPPPARSVLWILDLPGPLALEVAHALRRRRAVASALCFNAWYDPRGVLDGRAEIPLLLTLGERLAAAPAARGACLVFDARRHEPASAALLDNRYRLGDEDAPTIEHLRAAGYRGVTAITEGEPAPDLAAYLDYLGRELEVGLAAAVTRER
jgi:hypothetical protein